jgi:GNAT superfamily N-acetyltransferase
MSRLTDEEADRLIRQLVWFVDPQLVKLVMKDDQAVGFFFAYPDISAAVQRTGGRIFPLGWIQLLREAKQTRCVDLTGFGISEEYRGLGGTVLLISEIYKTMIEKGYQYLEFVHARADNPEMLRELEFIGLNYYKTHRVYEHIL